MKQPRLLTDALREVRRTLGRFLSLFLLSALAVAFLAGLRTTAPDMEVSADVYYDAQGLMDVHILSTLGLTDEDLTFLSAQEGISCVEGAYSVDALIRGFENERAVKVLSLSDQINLPRLVEGRLPQKANECLVEPALLADLGLSLGDKLPLDTGDGSYEDALRYGALVVVGTADSPLYVSIERGSSTLGTGRVFAFVLAHRDAFDMEAYTDAYLLADGMAELVCYGDAYEDHMEGLLDTLEPLGDWRAELRYDQVIDEANDKLDEAQQEFDEAEAEVAQELADAEQELADGRRELDDGWAEYRQGLLDFDREMAEAQQELQDAELIDLPDALLQLEDGEREYADGVTEWEDGLAEYQDGVREYNDGYYEIVSNLPEVNDGLDKLMDGEREYADGLKEYHLGLDKLASGGRQLMEAKVELDKARNLLAEAQWALSEGRSDLNEGSAALSQAWQAFQAMVDGVSGAAAMVGEPIDAQALLTPGAALSELQTYAALQVLQGALDQVAGQLAQLEAAGIGPGDATYDALVQQQAGLEQTMAAASADDPAAPYAIPAFLQAQRAALATQQGAVDDGMDQLDNAAQSLVWGQMEYEDGKAEYDKSVIEYEDGAAELQDAGKTLADARKELDDGWRDYREGLSELDDGWDELGEAQLALADAWEELMDGQLELQDGRTELDDGWDEYHQGLLDLAEGKVTLEEERAKALQTLADAKLELEDGEREYADGLLEYEDGRAEAAQELADARNKINQARRDIADIESCKWYVLGRNTNMGYVSFQQNAQRMGNIADLFPLIFFLVAALVCLTTMTRMVEEQRVQIGGLKALGYSKWAISVKYVGYGLASSLLGGLVGLAVGCTVIPWIIYTAWCASMYTLGALVIPPSPQIYLVSVGAAVLTVAGSALLTCWSTLTEVPAQLMRPRSPKAGKRVFLERLGPLWRRFSFTQKVTARNLFRYKRRFFMTVAGIGGCTALIITGFGVRDSIFATMDLQYGDIYTYHSRVALAEDPTSDELAELHRTLDTSADVSDYLFVHETALSVEGKQATADATLVSVPDPEHFSSFVHLHHRLDRNPVSLPAEGAVLTEKLADLLDVSVGDTVTLSGDRRVQVTVADITENYIMHYVYLTDGCYEQLYGSPPGENSILCAYAQDDRDTANRVAESLVTLSGVSSVSYIRDTRNSFQQSVETVNYAVLIIIVAAAALAFVVLFNLTNINMTERMRELATLKVLGFYNRELSAYVYRENVVLTLFGILAGLVLGKYLHSWLILTVEIDMLMFGRQAKPASYLYAVLLTALFSVLVNLAASRKLHQIDMVESLKTVE